MPDWSILSQPNFAQAALGGYQAGQALGRQKRLDTALAGVDLERPETITPVLSADPTTGAALLGTSMKMAEYKHELAGKAATSDYLIARLGLDKSGESKPPTSAPAPAAAQTAVNGAADSTAQQTSGYMGFGYARPGTADTNEATWDKRADGSAKGHGFLGLLQRPSGGVSSEISIGVDGSEIGSKQSEIEIPTMVPSLNQAELSALLTKPEDWVAQSQEPLARSIRAKAADHARGRIQRGQSPFAQTNESPDLQAAKDQNQITVTAPHANPEAARVAMIRNDPDAYIKLETSLAGMDEAKQKAVTGIVGTFDAALQGVKTLPYAQRSAYLANHRDALIQAGVPAQQIDSFDPTDENITAVDNQVLGVKGILERQDKDRSFKLQSDRFAHDVAHDSVTERQGDARIGLEAANVGIARGHLALDQQKANTGNGAAPVVTRKLANGVTAYRNPANGKWYDNAAFK